MIINNDNLLFLVIFYHQKNVLLFFCLSLYSQMKTRKAKPHTNQHLAPKKPATNMESQEWLLHVWIFF